MSGQARERRDATDYVELLVRVPTPAGGGIEVHHYSEVRKVEGRTTYLTLA